MNTNIRTDMQAAINALGSPPDPTQRSSTSDLSIDETLLLHQMGYEPTDLVSGISVVSIPYGTFITPYGQSGPIELPPATQAVATAFRIAAERARHECAGANGIGVVGVHVEVEVGGQSVSVCFTGTAVSPIERPKAPTNQPFLTDLSVRDFALLSRSGWQPVELVAGASFVAAPLQGMRQVLSQAGQNIELPLITGALQTSREKAMDQMQSAAIALSAAGVVDVSIIDGPLGHSRHICAFICWGTAIRLVAERHQPIEPRLVVPLHDHIDFEATSIR